jgi:protein-S-isoprenylcysteine O-methyltransferase Ste14
MMTKLFKGVYFAGVVAEMALRIPYDRRRRQIAKVDQRVTGAEQRLLAGLFAGLLGLPLAYSLTPWLDFADYPLSPRGQRRAGIAGSALLGAAIWLFWRAHRDLGTNWSPSLEIGAQHTLSTEGVYRHIRHPMYASHLLWGLAQALLLPNWIAGLASLVAFLPLYLSRVPREERMMLEHFGEQYRAYCDRTGRILPRLGKLRSP